jgi:hypothetical protein
MSEHVDFIRRCKGMTENIRLIDIMTRYNVCSFRILSSTNTLYDIIVQNYGDEILIECTCNDYCKRDKVCKHLCWVGLKILGVSENNMIKWQDTKMIHNEYEIEKKLDEFLLDYYMSYAFTKRGKNETCPICLEHINYQIECVVCCEDGCNNAIHANCWNTYQIYNYTNKCILCRQYTMPST